MPDYYPLFNVDGKPVFNLSGQRVFARVRPGSIAVSTEVSGTCTASGSIPGGTQSYTFSAVLTRSSYTGFLSSLNDGASAPYLFIGSDNGKSFYVRLICFLHNFLYVSKSVGWRFKIAIGFSRFYLLNGNYYQHSGCHESFYYHKEAQVYIPEGTTVQQSPQGDHYYDSGFSLSIESTQSLVFNES